MKLPAFAFLATAFALIGTASEAQTSKAQPMPPQPAERADLTQFRVGDIVMSVLNPDDFRTHHGDKDPPHAWFPCDGKTSLAGTELAAMLKTPDFGGRYPRGFQDDVPDLDREHGETGNAGTILHGEVGQHGHSLTVSTSTFDHGGDDTGPVVADTGNKWTYPVTASGGKENRPDSVIVYFYIKAR